MRRLTTVLTAVAAVLLLPGCSDPGATTCAEFGAMSHDDRQDTLQSLLKSHRLEPKNFVNQQGVQSAVDSYCGTTTNSILGDSPATRNSTLPIDDAVNWDSPYW